MLKPICIALLATIAVAGVASAQTDVAPIHLNLAAARIAGGSADQSLTSITVSGGTIYAGTDTGQVIRYPIPPGAPMVSAPLSGVALLGLVVSGNVLYAAGYATPPTCGAHDTVGDVEPKSRLCGRR